MAEGTRLLSEYGLTPIEGSNPSLSAGKDMPGGVAEWSKAPVLKTGRCRSFVGSNPTPSFVHTVVHHI